MEAWEALDVDDSDLPSLLRPCKRHHDHDHDSQNPPINQIQTTTPSDSQPLYSSHLSQSQTLNSYYSQHQFDSSSSSSSWRLIPGPAGLIQAAMLRKARDSHNLSSHQTPIPTQEYIRRAMDDPQEDPDFNTNPWLCAIDFLTRESHGIVDGVLPSSPLSSIKKCLNVGKIDQVVAVIKSCTPNGLGDLLVTLKDPTGIIGASIHRKVLAEGEYAKDISVGSVLILQKVAYFAPSRSAHYLNITLNNMVKVISKDTGPLLKQNYPASAVKYAAPGTESECGGKARMLEKAISLQQERTVGIMNEIRQNTNAKGSLHVAKLKEKGNKISGIGHYCNERSINQNAAVGKEPSVKQGAVQEIFKAAVRIKITDDGGALDTNNKWLKGANPSGSLETTSVSENMAENQNDEEIQRIDGLRMQRQLLIPRASLPEWTDEQINELFAGDCDDDDGSLF